MEVKILLWTCCFKFVLDFGDFILRVFVAEWIRESEVGNLIWLVTEHVLESQNELIVLIDKVIRFREYSPPLFLSVRKDTEDWLESLPVEFGLIIQIFKCESELLSLWYTFH